MFLRGFSLDGRVNRRGEDGCTQLNLRIENVFTRRHFYSMPAGDLPVDLLVENGLALVEDFVNPLLARLRHGQPICDTDKQWMASFFGLLRTRSVSMRRVILETLAGRLRSAGHSVAQLDDRLGAQVGLADGSTESVRQGALLTMLDWGFREYGREFYESEWALQRVPAHRIVLSREPVTHLIQGGAEFLLIPLDHQTVLYIYPPNKPPGVTLTSGVINWLTTRFTDEMVWHPAYPTPRIRRPWWAELVQLERGRLPDAA
jgi:hypothetical protein